MIFALVGNQNCGKTTLFNQLTGSNQHVGNFPGVTVDQKMGQIRGVKNATVVDLPGIYSIRPYTNEEIVTRDFILNEKPDGIINIVDATNIERNLYLTLQLMEMRIPMVLALNMMDEVRNNGGSIDVTGMADALGIPVVPISAFVGEGVEELITTLLHTVKNRQRPKVYDFCPSGPVHRCIHAVSHQIEDHAEKAGISPRFAATKLIEEDPSIIERLELEQNELDGIEHAVLQMEEERGLDRQAALADMRYNFIEQVCRKTVVRCAESKEHRRSVRIDSVLTHRVFAIPIFLVIMLVIFWLTFRVIGQSLSDLLGAGIAQLTELVDRGLTAYGINPVVHSLVIDGIFSGVGSVLGFLPIIVTLFFFYFGGYRLYGTDRVCYGQAAAKDRPFRAQYRADAHRLWLQRPRGYGDTDPLLRAGPAHDDLADPLYELQREDPHLRAVCRGVFCSGPGAGDGGHVCNGYCCLRYCRIDSKNDGVPGQSGAFCHGAAEL